MTLLPTNLPWARPTVRNAGEWAPSEGREPRPRATSGSWQRYSADRGYKG
jgi:hypothetical protein